MKKEHGKILTAVFLVILGFSGLIILVPHVELAIGFVSLTFGLLAIIWAYRAKASLSEGTDLFSYAYYFLFALIFIVIYSVWDLLLVIMFNWTNYLVYPKYFFLILAYLVFVIASYKILYVGKQFGFKQQAGRASSIKSSEIKKAAKKGYREL